MNGIFCKPEMLKEALNGEGLYSHISQGVIDPLSRNTNQFVFDEIMELDKPEEEKLKLLLGKGFISEGDYKLLKKCISKEDTTPRKILVSYPEKFYNKHFGPITLQQAMYAFCEDQKSLSEYEREKVVGFYFGEHELLGLLKDKMNSHEYWLVKNNIGRD